LFTTLSLLSAMEVASNPLCDIAGITVQLMNSVIFQMINANCETVAGIVVS